MSRSSLPLLLILVASTSFVAGCRPQADGDWGEPSAHPHEDLDATLWMQTSAEYLATTRQAYRTARDRLAVAMKDPDWSALPEQQIRLRQPAAGDPLPPAVILDVDETALDNSPFQARLIKDNADYDVETWHGWVEEARAEALPGVKDFVDYARSRDVTVIFVTNRENLVERATRRNLETEGLLEPGSDDTILSKNERDNWGSDKTTRRAFIARRYRILLIIGDDLNDFISVGFKPTAADRRNLAIRHQHLWGDKWILLPNANYGGWERALFDWDDSAPAAVKLQKKHDHLNLAQPPEEPLEGAAAEPSK